MAAKEENSQRNEQDKVRNHSLFPLIAYLATKCDEAMALFSEKVDVEAEELNHILSNMDARESDDKQLNLFMWNVVLHLRHQLYEIHKVSDLCNDFLRKYSSNPDLKPNLLMNLRQFVHFSPDFEDDASPSSLDSFSQSDNSLSNNKEMDKILAPVATIQTPSGPISVSLYNHPSFSEKSVPAFNSVLTNPLTTLNVLSAVNNENAVSTDFDDHNDWARTKRTCLPKKSVEVLRCWLFQNISHPYPSEDEKRQLSVETGLNLTQVNNWFINARRRILQPLLMDGTYSSSDAVIQNVPSSYAKDSNQEHQRDDDICNKKKDTIKNNDCGDETIIKKKISRSRTTVYSVDNLL